MTNKELKEILDECKGIYLTVADVATIESLKNEFNYIVLDLAITNVGAKALDIYGVDDLSDIESLEDIKILEVEKW